MNEVKGIVSAPHKGRVSHIVGLYIIQAGHTLGTLGLSLK